MPLADEKMTTSMEETYVTLCDICLEGVLTKDQIFLRSCDVHNGNFHEDCIAKLVYEKSEEQKVEPTCPTCHQPIPKEQTEVMLAQGIELMGPQQQAPIGEVATVDVFAIWYRSYSAPLDRGEDWNSSTDGDPESDLIIPMWVLNRSVNSVANDLDELFHAMETHPFL